MPWFRIAFAENAFLRLLEERGLSLETLTVEQGIEAMTAFHADHRAQHTIGGGGEDSLRQRRHGDTVTISRRMTRTDGELTRVLRITVGPDGGRLTFS